MSDRLEYGDLSLQQQVEFDRLCGDFESAWANGQNPRLEDWLTRFPLPVQSAAFDELLGVELELRARFGVPIDDDEYVQRFPQYADLIALEFQRSRDKLKSQRKTVSAAQTVIDLGNVVGRSHIRRWLAGTLGVDEVKHLEAELRSDEHLTHALLSTLLGQFQKSGEASTGEFGEPGNECFERDGLSSYRTRIGPFRILKFLGAGGMGIVFEAEDEDLHRRVALKTLKPSIASDPRAVARFVREMQSAASLRHDNIVTIYQVGQECGIPYCAFELLQGISLAQHLRTLTTLSASEVIKISLQVAQGLAAAHGRGVVHRDITPNNIWLVEPDLHDTNGDFEETTTGTGGARRWQRVKLLDFGLAKSQFANTKLTDPGQIMGTPHYMSPEQATGQEVDARADLFSLGCVMFRCLTGQLPFPGDGILAVLEKVRSHPHQPLLELAPNTPLPLAALIDRLLSKDRAARPEGAWEVARALQSLVDDTQGESRRKSAGTNGGSTEVERPVIAAQPRFSLRQWLVSVTALVTQKRSQE